VGAVLKGNRVQEIDCHVARSLERRKKRVIKWLLED
jgi:hypothetical protein